MPENIEVLDSDVDKPCGHKFRRRFASRTFSLSSSAASDPIADVTVPRCVPIIVQFGNWLISAALHPSFRAAGDPNPAQGGSYIFG